MIRRPSQISVVHRIACTVSISALLFVLPLSLLVPGCKPGPGSSCDKGDARCVDAKTELICQNGKFIETPCRGPGGCLLEGEAVRCDISTNREGDVCSTDEEGASVCSDGQHMLSCRKGKYVSVACRGQNGCEREGDRSHCDQSVATPGEACEKGASKACSLDSRQVLSCQGEKMERALECRGPRGCTAVGGKIDCDLSIAIVGDACDPKLQGHIACAPDGMAMVRCEQGRFVADERCKSGAHCETTGSATSCVK